MASSASHWKPIVGLGAGLGLPFATRLLSRARPLLSSARRVGSRIGSRFGAASTTAFTRSRPYASRAAAFARSPTIRAAGLGAATGAGGLSAYQKFRNRNKRVVTFQR